MQNAGVWAPGFLSRCHMSGNKRFREEEIPKSPKDTGGSNGEDEDFEDVEYADE